MNPLNAVQHLDRVPAPPVFPVEPERPPVGGGGDVEAGLGRVACRLPDPLDARAVRAEDQPRTPPRAGHRTRRDKPVVLDRAVDLADERLAAGRLGREQRKTEGPHGKVGPAQLQRELDGNVMGRGLARVQDAEGGLERAQRRKGWHGRFRRLAALRDGAEDKAVERPWAGIDEEDGAVGVVADAADEVGQRGVAGIDGDGLGLGKLDGERAAAGGKKEVIGAGLEGDGKRHGAVAIDVAGAGLAVDVGHGMATGLQQQDAVAVGDERHVHVAAAHGRMLEGAVGLGRDPLPDAVGAAGVPQHLTRGRRRPCAGHDARLHRVGPERRPGHAPAQHHRHALPQDDVLGQQVERQEREDAEGNPWESLHPEMLPARRAGCQGPRAQPESAVKVPNRLPPCLSQPFNPKTAMGVGISPTLRWRPRLDRCRSPGALARRRGCRTSGRRGRVAGASCRRTGSSRSRDGSATFSPGEGARPTTRTGPFQPHARGEVSEGCRRASLP